MSGFDSRVKAVLGPTNTGKTHLALDRLLAHSSGVIGFPLRLLARENYDRMVARKGAGNVALITGEEKIAPPGARWVSCTVEAMPLDRPAEFVAVDEIQLCADPDRGHVFTERLLHARGLVETMFLGADTIRPLVRRLVPRASVETRPRLSRLTHTGHTKLTRLAPRTAIVAFSATEVYAIAELIRRRRGGCAVVMGRLSPRTRNAQVALYQNKEVDFLVATDAIGMGLNMDVDHVAFAGLGKHDGTRPRRLTAAEIAQIAGRAGRGMRDGTFGTTAEAPFIPDDIAARVEAHGFEPLDHVCWRNASLRFNDLDALLASLQEMPLEPGLRKGNDASDLVTLMALGRDPEIRRIAQGRARVRLLWEVCQIPDFRKLADESHNALCARIFSCLAADRRLPTDWLAGHIDNLAKPDGDIDTLMQRLAGVRVWSYIAARADWVRDATHWQERARAVEDLLSDALHDRLTARFVDRRAAALMRRLRDAKGDELLSAVTQKGEIVVEGHAVGHLAGLDFVAGPSASADERRLVGRAARRAVRQEMPARVARIETDADTRLALTAEHRVVWDNAVIARLRPGPTVLRPSIQPIDSEFITGVERERLRSRLQAFIDSSIRTDLAPLFAAAARAEADPALRGPIHRLTEALGVLAGRAADIDSVSRRALKALGVKAGRFALFMPALLKPRAALMRARLLALSLGISVPDAISPTLVSLLRPAGWPEGFGEAMGWLQAGPVLIRLDIAERVAAELAFAARRGAIEPPAHLASRLAVSSEALPAVLKGLGFRLLPGGGLADGVAGPPAPTMLMVPRHHRPSLAPASRRIPEGGPFAALAALRR